MAPSKSRATYELSPFWISSEYGLGPTFAGAAGAAAGVLAGAAGAAAGAAGAAGGGAAGVCAAAEALTANVTNASRIGIGRRMLRRLPRPLAARIAHDFSTNEAPRPRLPVRPQDVDELGSNSSESIHQPSRMRP